MTIHESFRELLCVYHSVNHAPRVIAHVHRSVATERNPHGTPHPPVFLRFARRQPSGDEIFCAALRLAFVVEFHAYDFVPGRLAAIPRTMKCYEDVVAVLGGELR